MDNDDNKKALFSLHVGFKLVYTLHLTASVGIYNYLQTDIKI